MNLLVLDLELNNKDLPNIAPKIIQIGAVILNLETGNVPAQLSVYINPHEELAPFIINLTGITQNDVDHGLELEGAYEELKKFHKDYNCHFTPVVWGAGDCEALRSELGLDNKSFIFGRRYFDAKTLYQTYQIMNNKNPASGLAKALIKLGLKFEGRKHNAVDDAYNTAIIFYKLAKKLKNILVEDGSKV